MAHCEDNEADRDLGRYWEKQFCRMATVQFGQTVTPLQVNLAGAARAYSINDHSWNKYLLPDVVIWQLPGQLHEIKHKCPTAKHKTYGLEVYRFESLIGFMEETDQNIYYTIHDWKLAGGRAIKENHLDHWVTVHIRELMGKQRGPFWGASYVNGERKEVQIFYWDANLWYSLQQLWEANLSRAWGRVPSRETQVVR